MLLRSIFLLVTVSAPASSVAASPAQLDQVSPATNAWFYTHRGDVWQQQVRCAVDGVLDSFEVTVEGPIGAQVELRLRAGDGWNVGPIEWLALYTKTTAAQERPVFDVRAEGIVLAAGDGFVLEAEGNGTGAELVGSYLHPSLGPAGYPEELLLGGPGCYLDCGWRIGFRTWMGNAPSSGRDRMEVPVIPCVPLPSVTGAPTLLGIPSPIAVRPRRSAASSRSRRLRTGRAGTA